VRFAAELGGETVFIEVTEESGRYRVDVGGEALEVDAREVGEGVWSLVVGGASHLVAVSDREGRSAVDVDGESYGIHVEEETRYIVRARGDQGATGAQVLRAPMPGKVVLIEVEAGQPVAAGDGLVVLEAMKMENEFRAQRAGRVREIRVSAGQTVNAGDVLVVIE